MAFQALSQKELALKDQISLFSKILTSDLSKDLRKETSVRILSELQNSIKQRLHQLNLLDCKKILSAFCNSQQLQKFDSFQQLIQALVLGYFKDTDQLTGNFKSVAKNLALFSAEFSDLRQELKVEFMKIIVLFKNKSELQSDLTIISSLLKAADSLLIPQQKQGILKQLNETNQKKKFNARDSLEFLIEIDKKEDFKAIAPSFIEHSHLALKQIKFNNLPFSYKIKLLHFLTFKSSKAQPKRDLDKLSSQILDSLKEQQTIIDYQTAYRLVRVTSRLSTNMRTEFIDRFVQHAMKNLKKTSIRNYLRISEIFTLDPSFRLNSFYNSEVFYLTPFQVSEVLRSLQPHDLPILATIIKHGGIIDYSMSEIIKLFLRCGKQKLSSQVKNVNSIIGLLPREFIKSGASYVSPLQLIQLIQVLRIVKDFEHMPYLLSLLAQFVKNSTIRESQSWEESSDKLLHFSKLQFLEICYSLASHSHLLKSIPGSNPSIPQEEAFGQISDLEFQRIEQDLCRIHEDLQFYEIEQEIDTRSKILSTLSLFSIWKGVSKLAYIFSEFIELQNYEIRNYSPNTIPSLLLGMCAFNYFDRDLLIKQSKEYYSIHKPKEIEQYKENLKHALTICEQMKDPEKYEDLCIAALRAKKEKLS